MCGSTIKAKNIWMRVTRVGERERGRHEVKLIWQARLRDTEAGAYLNCQCPLIDPSSTFLLAPFLRSGTVPYLGAYCSKQLRI